MIVEIDERPRCPRCGGPMNISLAIVCLGGGRGESLDLPVACADAECRRRGQAERDAAAMARAIAKGLIDP